MGRTHLTQWYDQIEIRLSTARNIYFPNVWVALPRGGSCQPAGEKKCRWIYSGQVPLRPASSSLPLMYFCPLPDLLSELLLLKLKNPSFFTSSSHHVPPEDHQRTVLQTGEPGGLFCISVLGFPIQEGIEGPITSHGAIPSRPMVPLGIGGGGGGAGRDGGQGGACGSAGGGSGGVRQRGAGGGRPGPGGGLGHRPGGRRAGGRAPGRPKPAACRPTVCTPLLLWAGWSRHISLENGHFHASPAPLPPPALALGGGL